MWSKGTIGVPQKDGSYIACKYWVKHYEEGSEWGIDEGRISKLEIRINGKITANYDRGWDIEPEDETAQTALAILLKEYN